ncbi:COX15/CtaA family protein [Tessaracoccus oleiagri]|uniref:Cytochrome c oxidase assembly protein subunit 15 n=1 Tax=Tessaracoccus oleiagri TaxID=686624 RepID=A0A1G9LMD0_9ACTN|nr:COX15/CtaA family protein [Tessaracoccus oleiagri]SDL62927.1 cytochrome c oxidase assembly protein subunit 15 [Tessaracoccus oleiagri]
MDLLMAKREKAARVWLWISLVANMGIVVTGAIVRLTGSGLGCPTWPRCTDESFVPHGELGIHGAIEFGNRLLTFVLIVAALGAFVTVWRAFGRASQLWWLTLAVGIGIILQAVVGGITVWVDLHPTLVGIHLVLSVVLIVLCVRALVLAYRRAPVVVSGRLRALTVVTFVAAMVSIVIGTLTTGAGPHAGDADAPRNGLDIESIARVHALSAWLALFLSAACVYVFHRARLQYPQRVSAVLFGTVLLQGVIGYVQYFLGIPISVVWMHMVGLVLLTAAVAWQLFSTKAETR